jgi:hypothetical protein
VGGRESTLGTADTYQILLKLSFIKNFLEAGMTMKMALEILSKEMVNIGWVIKIFTC